MEHIRQRWLAYSLSSLLLLVGILAGAIAIRTLSLPQKQDLIGYINQYFDSVLLGKFEPASWQSVVWANTQTVLFQLLCGLIVFGVPCILGYLFLKGFIIGFSVGFFVDEMGLRGLLFASASVVPHHLVAVPALLGLSAIALSFAFDSLAGRRRGLASRRGRSSAYGEYILHALPFVLLMTLASLVEVYITPVFIRAAVSLF